MKNTSSNPLGFSVKQTAGNNDYLGRVKAQYNAKIFRSASTIYNGQGHDAAQRYLQQFTRRPLFLIVPRCWEIARNLNLDAKGLIPDTV